MRIPSKLHILVHVHVYQTGTDGKEGMSRVGNEPRGFSQVQLGGSSYGIVFDVFFLSGAAALWVHSATNDEPEP